jgi:hypothetical protein
MDIVSIIAQQAPTTADPLTLFTSLGVAGLISLVVYLWQRDTAAQRDRLQKSYEDLTPVLAEVRDAIRESNEVHKVSADAHRASAAALSHVPTEEVWTRLRVALEQVEALNKRAVSRGE